MTILNKISDLLASKVFKLITKTPLDSENDKRIRGLIFCEDVDSLERVPCGFIVILKKETFKNLVSEHLYKKLNENKIIALCLSGNEDDVLEIQIKHAENNNIAILVCPEIYNISYLMKHISDNLFLDNKDIYPNQKDFSIELIEQPDIQSLLLQLFQLNKHNVAYKDILNNITFVQSSNIEFNEQVRTYPIEELKKIFTCIAIIDEKYECGFLIFEKIESLPHSIINAAVFGIKLNVRKNLQNEILHKKYYINLFRDIIDNKIQDNITLLQRLRSINIRKDCQCFCILMTHEFFENKKYNDYQKNLWIKLLEKYFSFHFHKVFVIHKPEYTLLIILLNEGQSMNKIKIKENITNSCQMLFENITANLDLPKTIGISNIKDSLIELKEAVFESKNSSAYAGINKMGYSPIFWDDLGAFKIICSFSNSVEARKHHLKFLSKIIEYDKIHNGELIDTLICLEKSNWNTRQVSEKLLFHPNTIRYRFRKITELIDGDIDNSDFRFDLGLAIKLHQIYSWEEIQSVHKDAFFS